VIRKILLSIGLSFSIAWFTGAYLIKSKVVLLIRNTESDNVKLSYSDIKVSGFPTVWKIDLIEPKIIFINSVNSKEVSIKELTCLFDFSLKKAKIIIVKELKYKQNLDDEKTEYSIHLGKDTETLIKINKPIYNVSTTDNIDTVVKSIKLKSNLLSFIYDDKEMFNITDLIFALNKNHHNENEDILVTLQASYKNQDNLLNFNSANLYFDGVFSVNVISNLPRYINSLKVNQLNLAFEDSKIGLNGAVEFLKGKFPQGKFAINLHNYDDIINNVIPDRFIIPRPILKKLIEKIATKNSDGVDQANNPASVNTIEFDLGFSDNGINIDSVNLLDFKVED
jgi:hypothetical protein